MSTIAIYEPPLGCATGACGPDGQDTLEQFASSLEWLEQRGISVMRYNLGYDPGEFSGNAMVKDIMDTDGIACLPLVFANGSIVSKGRYPSRAELGNSVGLEA